MDLPPHAVRLHLDLPLPQDAAQNHYRSVRRTFSPMVFFDLDGHWTETFPIKPVLEALFREEDQAMVCWTSDVDEAVEFIDRFVIPDP